MLTDYDFSAANETEVTSIDPWQIISVFDEDNSTNVVCEGYSKAFQYLCDLSGFEGSVSCICVSGVMSGGTGAGNHMWNIVTMDDEKNYLADITNCDGSAVGAPDKLFLTGYTSGDSDSQYVFSLGSGDVNYKYDDLTLDMFGHELVLSDSNYTPVTHVFDDGVITTQPTCTEAGIKTYTCSDCGKTRTEEIPALGHDYKLDENTAVAATCTEPGKNADQKCSICDSVIEGEAIAALGHDWGEWTRGKAPTCAEDGVETRTCSRDSNHTETRNIPATGDHSWNSGEVTTPATCETNGVKTYTCTVCGETRSEEIPALEHETTETVTKATLTKNGSIIEKCANCEEVVSETTIYYPKAFKLSAATYAYNGKIRKPTVKVTDANGETIPASNYTLKYSAASPKNVGKYTVTVKFKGNYSGSKALTYFIAPKGTAVKSLAAAKKALTVKWTKQGTKMSKSYVTGYQIQLATDKKFKKNVKTVTAAKYGTVSKKVTGLKAKTNYYVRIRTYMKVGTKTYYSSWSGAKVKKTK